MEVFRLSRRSRISENCDRVKTTPCVLQGPQQIMSQVGHYLSGLEKRMKEFDQRVNVAIRLCLAPFFQRVIPDLEKPHLGRRITLAGMRRPAGSGFLDHRFRIQGGEPTFVSLGSCTQFFAQPSPFSLLLPFVIPADKVTNVFARRAIEPGFTHPFLEEFSQSPCKSDIDAFSHSRKNFKYRNIVPQIVNFVGQ